MLKFNKAKYSDLTISRDDSGQLTCPVCKHGDLKVEKDTVVEAELASSKRAKGHDDWEPEWIEERVTCILRCQKSGCEEVVAMVGKSVWREYYDDNGPAGASCVFSPLFFDPPVHLFDVPQESPKQVQEFISAASRQLFIDPGACVNNLRSGLEFVLTHQGVARFPKKGKRIPLSLNKRIEAYVSSRKDKKELLHAIRRLGNVGSHGQSVSRSDALDCFEIFEHALDRIYNQKEKAIVRLAKEIAAKGARSKRR